MVHRGNVPQHDIGVGDGFAIADVIRQLSVTQFVVMVACDPKIVVRKRFLMPRRTAAQRHQIISNVSSMAVLSLGVDYSQLCEFSGVPVSKTFDALVEWDGAV